MSAKGSKLRYGNRDYIFSKEFYKTNLVEKRKTKLSYEQCKNLINSCNKSIAESIKKEVDGFKLPCGLGYIVVGKYKPTYELIDWKKSNEAGKHIYHLNLDTDGFAIKLYWFRVGRVFNTHFHEIYIFSAYKELGKSVSNAFKSGKSNYSEWRIPDFLEKSRGQNLFNKKYQKELKD